MIADLNHVILRYFNVAGSAPDGKIGQSTKNAALLIKIAAEVAVSLSATQKKIRLATLIHEYKNHD